MQKKNSRNENAARIGERPARSMPPVSPARQAQLEKMAAIGAAVNQKNREVSDNGDSVAARGFGAGKGTESSRGISDKRRTSHIKNSGGAAVIERRPRIRPPKVKERRERLAKFDYPLFMVVIVLLAFGIVTMFSASYAYAHRTHGDSYYYVFRQLIFIVIGLAAMFALSLMDYNKLLNKHTIKIGVAVTAFLMLLVPLAGTTQGGAERWLDFGGFTVQPSEILKFTLIVFFAYYIHTNYSKLDKLKEGFMPLLTFLIAACGLTIIQPHLSGTIIIFVIGIIMMFVGDCKVKHIIGMLGIFAVFGMAAIALMSAMGLNYFEARIESWLNPESDILDRTFQTYQSLITIGSGGVFGLGLGNSRQKYAYLPASHNDFIFSVICEELGFIGAILVILLFVLFVARGFYIASRARDKFGMLLAVGITSQLGMQALLNIGVVTNAVPNTGISLPFFSYGGSALIMQLAGIGVVLNISRKAAID